MYLLDNRSNYLIFCLMRRCFVSDPSFLSDDISSGYHLRLYRRFCSCWRIHGCNKNKLHYFLFSLVICKAHCIEHCCFSSLHNNKLLLQYYIKSCLIDRCWAWCIPGICYWTVQLASIPTSFMKSHPVMGIIVTILAVINVSNKHNNELIIAHNSCCSPVTPRDMWCNLHSALLHKYCSICVLEKRDRITAVWIARS